MSVVARPPQPELLTESGGIRNWLVSPAFPLLIGTLGCLPLLIVHFQQMWAKPHYQFFPLVFLAVAVLYQLRRSGPPTETIADRPLVSGVALVCGFLLAGFAVLRISPLLGWAAWLVICLSSVFRSRRDYWAAWGLLCLLLRLPQGKDVWLIQTLQRLTTGIASTALDQLQIDHIREGNVLAFPTHKLLVEEACSGIVSLFMIVATAAILGALLRRTFLHTILLMLAGGFWASAANILRVVTIAYCIEKVGLDLTVGWAHDALGMAVFVITLVMLLSTDSLLRFAFGPIEIDETGAPEPIHENWLVMLWNKLFWPTHERPDPVSPIPLVPLEPSSQPAWGWITLVSLISVGFIGLGGLQVWGGIGPFSRSLGISVHVDELSRESLPEELTGWKRVNFRDVDRRSTSEFGEKSRQWTYTRNDITATISIDYPFPEWHGLDSCYRGTGWKTRQDPAFPDCGTALQFTLVNDQQKGHLIYDMFDQFGQVYMPPIDTGVHPRWSRLWSGNATPWTLPTYYQIQVLCTREILENDHRSLRQELQLLFLAARSQLIQAMIPAPIHQGANP